MMLSVNMLTEGRFFMSEPGGYQEPPPAGPPPGGYQQPPSGGQIPGAEKKLVAGILAILLGAFGIHKFYLGYTQAAVIMLVATVITCGFAGAIMSIIGIVEGIMYLTKSDQEFVDMYVVGKKEWF